MIANPSQSVVADSAPPNPDPDTSTSRRLSAPAATSTDTPSVASFGQWKTAGKPVSVAPTEDLSLPFPTAPPAVSAAPTSPSAPAAPAVPSVPAATSATVATATPVSRLKKPSSSATQKIKYTPAVHAQRKAMSNIVSRVQSKRSSKAVPSLAPLSRARSTITPEETPSTTGVNISPNEADVTAAFPSSRAAEPESAAGQAAQLSLPVKMVKEEKKPVIMVSAGKESRAVQPTKDRAVSSSKKPGASNVSKVVVADTAPLFKVSDASPSSNDIKQELISAKTSLSSVEQKRTSDRPQRQPSENVGLKPVRKLAEISRGSPSEKPFDKPVEKRVKMRNEQPGVKPHEMEVRKAARKASKSLMKEPVVKNVEKLRKAVSSTAPSLSKDGNSSKVSGARGHSDSAPVHPQKSIEHDVDHEFMDVNVPGPKKSSCKGERGGSSSRQGLEAQASVGSRDSSKATSTPDVVSKPRSKLVKKSSTIVDVDAITPAKPQNSKKLRVEKTPSTTVDQTIQGHKVPSSSQKSENISLSNGYLFACIQEVIKIMFLLKLKKEIKSREDMVAFKQNILKLIRVNLRNYSKPQTALETSSILGLVPSQLKNSTPSNTKSSTSGRLDAEKSHARRLQQGVQGERPVLTTTEKNSNGVSKSNGKSRKDGLAASPVHKKSNVPERRKIEKQDIEKIKFSFVTWRNMVSAKKKFNSVIDQIVTDCHKLKTIQNDLEDEKCALSLSSGEILGHLQDLDIAAFTVQFVSKEYINLLLNLDQGQDLKRAFTVLERICSWAGYLLDRLRQLWTDLSESPNTNSFVKLCADVKDLIQHSQDVKKDNTSNVGIIGTWRSLRDILKKGTSKDERSLPMESSRLKLAEDVQRMIRILATISQRSERRLLSDSMDGIPGVSDGMQQPLPTIPRKTPPKVPPTPSPKVALPSGKSGSIPERKEPSGKIEKSGKKPSQDLKRSSSNGAGPSSMRVAAGISKSVSRRGGFNHSADVKKLLTAASTAVGKGVSNDGKNGNLLRKTSGAGPSCSKSGRIKGILKTPNSGRRGAKSRRVLFPPDLIAGGDAPKMTNDEIKTLFNDGYDLLGSHNPVQKAAVEDRCRELARGSVISLFGFLRSFIAAMESEMERRESPPPDWVELPYTPVAQKQFLKRMDARPKRQNSEKDHTNSADESMRDPINRSLR